MQIHSYQSTNLADTHIAIEMHQLIKSLFIKREKKIKRRKQEEEEKKKIMKIIRMWEKGFTDLKVTVILKIIGLSLH